MLLKVDTKILVKENPLAKEMAWVKRVLSIWFLIVLKIMKQKKAMVWAK